MNVFLGLNISAEELGVKRQNMWAFASNNINQDGLDYFNLDVQQVGKSDKDDIASAVPLPRLWTRTFPSCLSPSPRRRILSGATTQVTSCCMQSTVLTLPVQCSVNPTCPVLNPPMQGGRTRPPAPS